jgi:hypothetical protein
MSGCTDRYRALIDADRQWFANHPRRQHRTRYVLVDEVMAIPPLGPVPKQQYCAVLRHVRGGIQKLIFAPADEDVEPMGAIDAGLCEKRAAALWQRWFSLLPVADQRALEAWCTE